MIVGGAQENTLYNCLDLQEKFGDEVLLIAGPSLGPEGKLLEQGRAAGLKVELVNSLRRPIHPRDVLAYYQLRRILARFKPDVVHTHSAKGGLLGRAAAHRVRVRSGGEYCRAIVHTVHGAPFHPFQNAVARKFFQCCERWAAGRCDHFISVADAMTELMVQAGVAPRNRFSTIYSGMEVETFLNCRQQFRSQVRAELKLADSEVVVGKIARLYYLKGHEYLIEAARSLKHLPVKFLLVGDGILRARYEAEIEAMGLRDKFIFTGLVPPEKIPELLSAMDVLVHTSLREGLARTLPQALLSGIPAVSYDIDGAREVVISNQTGVLLPPQSVDELRDAIELLAGDEDLRNRLGMTGQELCKQRFNHQFMTEQIRKLYVSLLER